MNTDHAQPPLQTLEVQIGGILFHVEQPAYASLRAYLQDLKRCFPEDSMILEDIEIRVAEVLLERINVSKASINKNDVELMILQVGTAKEIALAEGIDLDLGYFERKSQWETLKTAEPKKPSRQPNTKLTLSEDGKRIGGVASGIANYYGIDPVWVRLGMIAAAFGSGVGILLYGALWVAMPKPKNKEKEGLVSRVRKRFMRSSTDKKVAGVASGIAKYFGIDETVVRLFFAGAIFLKGFGLLAYLALWAAMPQAKSLSDQLELEEEPSFLEDANFQRQWASLEEEAGKTTRKIKKINFRKMF